MWVDPYTLERCHGHLDADCPPVFLSMGYLFGFTLARLEYLSFHGVFCNPNASGGSGAAPGECYYYLKDPFKIGKSNVGKQSYDDG